jgi:hypothetical protein
VSEVPTIKWPGLSGMQYKYWIYAIGAPMKSQPGNYIFARQTESNTWSPCYIGQTPDLTVPRLDSRHKDCIRKQGATHMHAHLSSSKESVRMAEATDLSLHLRPPCNESPQD